MTGVGYGICEFFPKEEAPERDFLDQYLAKEAAKAAARKESEDPYVRLARTSLESYIRDHRRMDVPADLPAEMLNKRAGVFVSIHEHQRLRGCIGTIAPVTGSIAEEILRNAISASTEDPRFEPIKEEELEFLEINVDVLGEPERISGLEELDVKRYGVIVSKGRRRGLLLPDLDGVDTPAQQVSIARRKAGIGPDEEVELERFEVVRHQ